MTTFNAEIKKCPACRKKYGLNVMTSGNTIGAEYYTDLYMRAPMGSVGSAIIKCPNCCRYSWYDEVPTVKGLGRRCDWQNDSIWWSISRRFMLAVMEFFSAPTDCLYKNLNKTSIQHVYFVDTDDYGILMQKRFWRSEDEELYVRTRAWWAFNNTYRPIVTYEQVPNDRCIEYRELVDYGPLYSKEYVSIPENDANMIRLLELVAPDDPNNLLLRAELYRELGYFKDCIKELDGIEALNHCNVDQVRFAERIRELALEKQRKIALVVTFPPWN